MRVVHVVALADERGSYGGPVAVALGQATSLADTGHDVVVMAGGDAGAQDSRLVRYARSYRLIPNGKPSGRFSPRLMLRVAREARRRDVVHVHLSRDLTTLLAAFLATFGTARLVVQTHGMVVPTQSPSLRVLDLLFTRRVLAQAHRCLALTALETAALEQVSRGRARIERLHNGVLLREELFTRPREAEVLFLSRLATRKRPLAFVAMANLLVRRGTKATFAMAGPDEGQVSAVLAAIAAGEARDRVVYEGAVPPDAALQRLSRASVLVLPSVDEPFPMVVLEALAVGTPVVVTDSCHIAPALQAAGAAWVTDGSVDQLADAVSGLLENPARAGRQRDAGRRLVSGRFSIAAVTERLVKLYVE